MKNSRVEPQLLNRHGFTLPELLVVTAIMASLMGLVVAGTRPSRGAYGDIRRGAQQFASMLLVSQSYSLGNPTGSAVIVNSDGICSTVIYHARRYPFIEGRVGTLTAVSTTERAAALVAENDEVGALVHGFRIRFMERSNGVFGPPTGWFSFSCAVPPASVVKLRSENGQTPQNAIWPVLPSYGDLHFQVARYPTPTGVSESLPKGVAIDLRYSGCSDPSVANWGSLANRGAIAVGFDEVGSVDDLMQNVLPSSGSSRTVQPISLCEEVYFFFTSLKDIVDPAVNALASDKAVWVVVRPKSGRVTVSANVPQKADDAASLRAAREKARLGVALGG
jgi:prepilin-type N-terminal cleavage/methylation domain-containing protein